MTKRTIYLATFYGTENYGSNLQAIGLNKVLQRMGYDVYMLGGIKVLPFLLRHPSLIYARIYNRFHQRQNRDFFHVDPYRKSVERENRIAEFNSENYRSKSINSRKQWKRIIDEKSIFAAGADIIWNPAKGYPAKYFLDYAYFAKLPRFSFGSSIGAIELPKKYLKAYRRYLSSMVGVGVREESVVQMLEQIVHRKITKVTDPSMLLTKKEWDEYASKKRLSVHVSEDGFILCYFVMNDSRYWEYIHKIKAATGKQIIILPMHTSDEQQPYDVILDGTPYEFVWLIKHADFICTDSFHACVVSLIYEKEFYLLRRSRKAEDAKYDDFLNRYHLTGRVVTDESRFIPKEETDYSFAREQLEKDRAASIVFLNRTLDQC